MTKNEDAARFAWLAEGNVKQARKRVAVKALIRDSSDRLLLVNPNYKEHWDLPGGMTEANEPPASALVREIAEELDVGVTVGPLLTLDWVEPHGPWDDQLVFVFEASILAGDMTDRLKIADEELSDFGFFSLHEAEQRLRDDVAARLRRAVRALGSGRTSYAEDQR